MMRTKGSVILAVVFMMLIAFMGLSLLNFSLLHNRIAKARSIHGSRSAALHNLLTVTLHRDTEKISDTEFNGPVIDGAEYFNPVSYPGGRVGSMNLEKSFSFTTREFPVYKIIRSVFRIDVTAENGRQKWRSESIFNIVSGNIPFSFLPVIINPGAMSAETDRFTWPGGKTVNGSIPHHVNNNAEFDIRTYLLQILGISGEELSASGIMDRFGCPVGQGPAGDRICLNTSGDVAGPVFVNGDADKITLSSEGIFQQIEIVQNPDYLRISYSPQQIRIESPGESGILHRKFNEIVIVNGDVLELGSGSSPALTPGSSPEFIILGNINISSSITGKTGPQHSNIHSRITILSAPSPFSGTGSAPALSFSGSGPLIIHGSININGKILVAASEILVRGNIYCRNLSNPENIRVEPFINPEPLANDNFYLRDTAFIRDFRTESIEEVVPDE